MCAERPLCPDAQRRLVIGQRRAGKGNRRIHAQRRFVRASKILKHHAHVLGKREQRSEAQLRIRRKRINRSHHAFVCCTLHVVHSAQDYAGDLLRQISARRFRRKQLHQLLPDALAGNHAKVLAKGDRRANRFFLDGKTEARGKPEKPHDAQRILRKALHWLADRAQDAMLKQIHPAAEGIDQTRAVVIRHGVDRKIPTGKVVAHIGYKIDAVGMAAVGVRSLRAEGRHFVQPAVHLHRHRAVLEARRDAVFLPEDGDGLLRQRAGAYVPIIGHIAQQRIAYAAAHGIGVIASRNKRFNHLLRARFHDDALHTRASLPFFTNLVLFDGGWVFPFPSLKSARPHRL